MDIKFNGIESDHSFKQYTGTVFHTVNLSVSVDFSAGVFDPIALGDGFVVTPELDGDEFIWFNVTKDGVRFDDWAAIGGQKDEEVTLALDVDKNLAINLVLVDSSR